MSFISINPATGKEISTYLEMDLNSSLQRVEKSHESFKDWSQTKLSSRKICMHKAAEILNSKKEGFATCITEEMGKPILQSKAEIEKCIWACNYYAENAEAFLKSEPIETDAYKSYVSYQPLGVILAIMPWNFPFWQAFRAAIPALMAGNSMILKHASNVSGCGLAIAEVFQEADFPPNLFQTLLIKSATALSLIESPYIQGVTLTGSTTAGKSVGSKAGNYIKKCVLELGGSDPYIILDDANIENAASICAKSRLINTGQSCIAAKRFIIIESQYGKFEKLFLEHMKAAISGNPLEEKTTIGPLARMDLRETLHHQVSKSISLGASCLLGGFIPEGPGIFYPPTVLTNLQKGMPAYEEELFGPVASLISAKNVDEAISIANDTPYGLGAALFTEDIERGEHVILNQLNAGNCFLNSLVKSDPRLPFGGIKESGFGRELSHFGIKEFVNCKTIYISK